MQLGRERLPRRAVEHDHAGDERPVVAEHVRLLEQGVARDREFEIHRRDLLAGGGDDDLLDPAEDADAPGLDRCLVTGTQPTVDERAGGVVVALPVAAHHAGAAQQEFAVVADLRLDAGERATDRRRVVVVGCVRRDDRRGLGHAVALHDRNAQAEKAVRDRLRQRCAATDRDAQAAAELRAQRPRDQAVEQRPHHRVEPGGCPAFDRQRLCAAKAPPAHGLRPGEQPRLDRRARDRCLQPGVHALVDARHRNEDRRPHRLQILGQLVGRTCECHATAGGDRGVVAGGALEGVRQRQERQEHVTGHGRDAQQRGLHVRDHVAVRQHHAFGFAGRARGVDERGEVVGGRPCGRLRRTRVTARQPLVEVRHRRAARTAAGGCGALEHDDLPQRRQRDRGIDDRLPLRARRRHEQRSLAVAEDVGDAGGVVDRMQRHRHGRQRQHGLVDADRVQPVGQQDRDARAAR